MKEQLRSERRERSVTNGRTEGSFRIDETGKASDMEPAAVMSLDKCNPVNRDSEIQRAYEPEGMLFPGAVPQAIPGTASGALPGILPPAYFPGADNSAPR